MLPNPEPDLQTAMILLERFSYDLEMKARD